jgi:mono/diheme cytochrome c family protein
MRLAVLTLAGLALLTLAVWDFLRPQPAVGHRLALTLAASLSPDDRGKAQFAFGDHGALDLDTLETSALPWRIVTAALSLHMARGDADQVTPEAVAAAFRQFGFLYPKRFGNAPGLTPAADEPLGLILGTITRRAPPIALKAMNMGCAACHGGTTYDADGMPNPDVVWLGQPNTSLDLEAFTTTLFTALKTALADDERMLAAVARLDPAISLREWWTLRLVAVPRAKSRLAELVNSHGRPLPFPNGAPGLTNGVAALKMQLQVVSATEYRPDTGFVSIPDLGDRFFRSALLVDGAYAVKGQPRFRPIKREEALARPAEPLAAIASFFTVPSMGMRPERAVRHIDGLVEVMGALRNYRPQPFPGPIDLEKAAAGEAVYAARCAQCHGTYDAQGARLVSFPNQAGDVGTDKTRVTAFDQPLAAAAAQTRHGQTYMDVAATGVIAAPPLSGVWATAPYLSNGSVPTLRHLLEPETRPTAFEVGGHALDFNAVGIRLEQAADGVFRYPAGYQAFSKPVLFDTRRPGQANTGHTREVATLSSDERMALLEYLKRL